MSIGWSDLTPEGVRYFAELEKMIGLEVQVGWQGDEAYEDGTTVSEVAAYNELGTSTIPPRPFMKQSFEKHQRELQALCDDATNGIANGSTTEAELKKLGVGLRGLVQEEIVSGGFTPNAPSTIKKKGSAQPLIDTGFMRQSVNYVVKPRGASE